MANASIAHLGHEFDDFLFASIGEDKNGMPLSMLSALARLDVDPWREAAKLALLPGQTAIQRLASLIAALPDGPSIQLDVGTIAARLIALLPLPRESRSDTASRDGAAAAGRSRALIYAILMIFMMATQLIIASRQRPAQPDLASAPASSPITPPTPTDDDPIRPGEHRAE